MPFYLDPPIALSQLPHPKDLRHQRTVRPIQWSTLQVPRRQLPSHPPLGRVVKTNIVETVAVKLDRIDIGSDEHRQEADSFQFVRTRLRPPTRATTAPYGAGHP